MQYQRKEDRYDDYRSYSGTVLKRKEIQPGGNVHGYVPTHQEILENSAPVETMRMKNSSGQLSVGVNKDKEATITVTSDKPGPYLRGDRSRINMNSAKRIRETPDKLYTNSHDESVSGVVYKDDLVKSPRAMINTFKGVMETQPSVVIDAVTPFLISSQDYETKRELEDYLRSSLEKRDKDEYEMNRELLDRFNLRLARKEKEEQRMLHYLTTATERMKEQAKQLQFDLPRASYLPSEMQPTDGDDEDNRGDKQDNNQDKAQEKHNLIEKHQVSDQESNQESNQEKHQDNHKVDDKE